ncbi:DUF2461 domain-containing protein [Chishuiella sp.]|uniref:DUF2461 domain-containing protein n=1 Tax=Chishuiella sp. TaxID=1969467 RepID=UPI0028ACC02B|nr:DUF2461 domain-containing protein [Chishuiella sp.]
MSKIFSFLKQLEKNNNREWFNEHKEEFTEAKNQARVIFEDAYNQLSSKEELEPLKIYRINRDIRFSLDKTPYKIHFSAMMGRKKPYKRGGIYIHIQPNNSFIGAGFWGPERDDLLRIRKDIEVSDELVKILDNKALKSTFGQLEGDELKTAPKGFDKNHERVELLRKKQFLFTKSISDAEILADDFPKKFTEAIAVLTPFFDYMTEVLTTDENGESII